MAARKTTKLAISLIVLSCLLPPFGFALLIAALPRLVKPRKRASGE
ncbi:hypothetical protein NLM33_32910 [Bradyrhizobium sp. CCGUVB1N3]|nr:hypothetical protein [Bradyrhizobium sp. CCGUVB1N3]MCP3475126.1 hypothetical protein [Bradyrhizobium sp. CCGUVB1N3]